MARQGSPAVCARGAVFIEYVGYGLVDPCAAEQLSYEELRDLGMFWLGDNDPQFDQRPRRCGLCFTPMLIGAGSRSSCRRQEGESRQLAELAGWKLAEIREQMKLPVRTPVTNVAAVGGKGSGTAKR